MKVIKSKFKHGRKVSTAHQPQTTPNILKPICNNLYLKRIGLYQINYLKLYKGNILL